MAHFRDDSRFGTPRRIVQFLESEREYVQNLDGPPSQIHPPYPHERPNPSHPLCPSCWRAATFV